MLENPIVILAGLAVVGVFCQWLAWATRLPAILFLLVVGIAAGPVYGWVQPDALFGDLLFPFVSLAVAIILFEGSLTLKFREIRGLASVVRNMITIGVMVTWCVTTLAVHFLVDLSWPLAILFGAVTTVTGPTVIVPMLRTVRPNAKIASVLRWEGIVIDPIGATLAVLVFEFIVLGYGQQALEHTIMIFVRMLLIGFALGAAAGQLLGVILRRHAIPEYLQNVAVLSIVFGVFTASNMIADESGLLTVTVMGIWLANMRGIYLDEILGFKESLSLLFISGLFIILAARLDLNAFIALGGAGVGVYLVMQFVARPLKVLVSTWGSNLNWRERLLIAWIAPRGIVAAAVVALFAIRLRQLGFDEAEVLVPLTFMVIIGTVVVQSATSRIFARLLGVAEPEATGYLIVGANPVARAVAKALQEQDIKVILADTHWDNISAARMEGLPTYYGNPASEHAERHLELVGIGRLLAVSPNNELNSIAAWHYRHEFGPNNIFTVRPAGDEFRSEKLKVAPLYRGLNAFGKSVTYAKLASLLGQGAQIHATKLSAHFSYQGLLEKYGSMVIPLFAMNTRGRLYLITDNPHFWPVSGWTVISLISAEAWAREQEAETQPQPPAKSGPAAETPAPATTQ